MKRVKLLGLLAGILSTGAFWGCQTAPIEVERVVEKPVEVIVERPVEVYIEKPVDREVEVEVPGQTVYVDVPGPTVYVDVPGPTVYVDREVKVPVPETPPRTPLVPITQKIIRRVERNQLNIGSFQYYISEAIVLERAERTDKLTISETGEGWLEETVTLKQVEILPATRGVMKDSRDTNAYISAIGAVKESRNADGTVSAIEVCFDEDDPEKTLTFKKTAAEDRFILDYDYAKRTIHYGSETYKLRMFNTRNNPYLLVRYYEKTSNEPNVRKLGGRPKGPAAASPLPAALPAGYAEEYSREEPEEYSQENFEEYPEYQDYSEEVLY